VDLLGKGPGIVHRETEGEQQYEDDLDTFRLPGFATFDAYVSRKLSQTVTIFGAAENMLDRRYLVGLQGGVPTLGQPLSLRAGVRLTL